VAAGSRAHLSLKVSEKTPHGKARVHDASNPAGSESSAPVKQHKKTASKRSQKKETNQKDSSNERGKGEKGPDRQVHEVEEGKPKRKNAKRNRLPKAAYTMQGSGERLAGLEKLKGRRIRGIRVKITGKSSGSVVHVQQGLTKISKRKKPREEGKLGKSTSGHIVARRSKERGKDKSYGW